MRVKFEVATAALFASNDALTTDVPEAEFPTLNLKIPSP